MTKQYLLTLQSVYNSFFNQQDLIEKQLSLLNKGQLSLMIIPDHLFDYRIEEIKKYYLHLISELHHSHSFNSIALIEAKLRIDYITRSRMRKKDDLSRYFRSIYWQYGENVSLVENIIEAWKEYHSDYKSFFSNLKSLLHYRHWIAHGRSWTPKWGREYDFTEVYMICNNIDLAILNKSHN